MAYDAVLFDNDGVLVELADFEVLRTATRDAFEAVGVTPAPEDVDRMAGTVTPDLLEAVCDEHGLDPADFWAERDRHSSRAQIEAIRNGQKNLYDDFDAVRSLSVRRGIVSSNQQETIDFILSHYGIRDLFVTAYGREPTPESLVRKKPATYYVEKALDDLGTRNALFVGDSDSDIAAAATAGLDSVFVRRPHRRDHSPEPTPTFEVESLHALLDIVET